MRERAKAALRNARQLMVLTGAGISAPSGLPTYRGKDGMWTKHTTGTNPMTLATKAYFDINPYECWQLSFMFCDLVKQNSPNRIHRAILRLQEHCHLARISCDLVTQNVDGYHAKLISESSILPHKAYVPEGTPQYGFTEGVFEIHGNVHYTRCSLQGCSNTNMYSAPEVYNEDSIPRCANCSNIMRRHTLLFDEAYNEQFYKSDTVLNKCKTSELLIIAGTEIATNLPKRILKEHIKNKVTILEFNMTSFIPSSPSLITFLGKCEDTLPSFLEECLNQSIL